nr:sugar transferase [Rhodohalobacter sp. 614A]
MQPTYGALIRLNRVGKGGKMFRVFKMRTMYPYSEYLQDYIFKKHDLREGGKFRNDFRMTSWGKFFRRYWIDELPMVINWFRGEMKLVGVRPLSKHYFELYPKSLQEMRVKVKPGLVPPYYADMPKTLEEIEESERNYLIAYEKSPFLTDVRYFFRAFLNIFLKGARSK